MTSTPVHTWFIFTCKYSAQKHCPPLSLSLPISLSLSLSLPISLSLSLSLSLSIFLSYSALFISHTPGTQKHNFFTSFRSLSFRTNTRAQRHFLFLYPTIWAFFFPLTFSHILSQFLCCTHTLTLLQLSLSLSLTHTHTHTRTHAHPVLLRSAYLPSSSPSLPWSSDLTAACFHLLIFEASFNCQPRIYSPAQKVFLRFKLEASNFSSFITSEKFFFPLSAFSNEMNFLSLFWKVYSSVLNLGPKVDLMKSASLVYQEECLQKKRWRIELIKKAIELENKAAKKMYLYLTRCSFKGLQKAWR